MSLSNHLLSRFLMAGVKSETPVEELLFYQRLKNDFSQQAILALLKK